MDGEKIKLPANWLHTPGAYGCLLSHVEVVREARRLGLPSVLIFEDDVVFDDQLEKKFGVYIEQLPTDWDMLFFGALHRDEPIKVADNIVRITKAYSTYAYVLRNTIFDDFIALNSSFEQELDNNNLVLQQRYNCYCFMPHLAWVETDYSDAQQRLVDHWYIRESLVLFGPQLNQLLSETTIVFAYGDNRINVRASETLMYLVNYYDKLFSPHISIVIVEQDAQPTIDSSNLPSNCKYVLLRDEGPFDRERCFVEGLNHSKKHGKFVILSDGDIFLENLDIRANLRMCERYDCVTGFDKIIDLTIEDSIRLRNTRTTQGIDLSNSISQDCERTAICRFIKCDAIQTLGTLDEEEKMKLVLSTNVGETLRVFQSPNHALRLQ